MAGKGNGSGHRNGKSSDGTQMEEIPSAKELKTRCEKTFFALPLALQDAYVRLMETSLSAMKR